jgi:NAD(P)H dehydrogenase (quinone)
MTIVVTGATGHLGRLVIEALLRSDVEPGDILAAGRAVERLDDLARRGVRVARIEFADPTSLSAAFSGAEKVLLVSGSELGARVRLHANAVDAAVAAGVQRLVYTSIAHADTSRLLLAREHQGTEAYLRAAGLTHTLLRNSWYIDLYTEALPATLATGTILGAAGAGRVSATTRADYAQAAAAALLAEEPGDAVYELGADRAFTLAELAAEITALSGTTVSYTDLPDDEYRRTLEGFGLPAAAAAAYADGDRGIREGELLVETRDLSRLIGRPTTSLAEAVEAGLKAASLAI